MAKYPHRGDGPIIAKLYPTEEVHEQSNQRADPQRVGEVKTKAGRSHAAASGEAVPVKSAEPA